MNSQTLCGIDVNRLVAGLAHSIRNPLHAIGLNLHTLRVVHQQGQTLPEEEMGRMLSQCTTEIERIEQLMQQMLAFAAIDPAQPELLDLATELRSVVALIQEQRGAKGVQLHAEVPRRRVMVQIDRVRLRQILVNLLQGAEQLFGHGGQITVSLAQTGRHAVLTVADDGPALSHYVRRDVFDPFGTTTRGVTGLGLAVVKRLVEETSGEICCEPNDGPGTRFRILLPIAQPDALPQDTENENE
jgi:signal transduction histidine kinase